MTNYSLGKYLTLVDFCTCTQTYKNNTTKINPFPQNPETIIALKQLNFYLIDPIIDYFGLNRFKLTYGFCSADLKRYLNQKAPVTGLKNGRIAPTIDQHMAHELKSNGKRQCDRLGAACDFFILELASNQLVDWILSEQLPFDSLYFYGENRPIHLSYGPQHKRDIWTFTTTGVPTKKGIKKWCLINSKLS